MSDPIKILSARLPAPEPSPELAKKLDRIARMKGGNVRLLTEDEYTDAVTVFNVALDHEGDRERGWLMWKGAQIVVSRRFVADERKRGTFRAFRIN